MKMDGRIVSLLLVKFGTVTFSAVVHVAPINNDMLLGLDFLLKIGATINLKELFLLVTGATEKVPYKSCKSFNFKSYCRSCRTNLIHKQPTCTLYFRRDVTDKGTLP